jgi:AraC-like DNA-binding protein
MEISTVPIHYVRSISDAARRHGCDPAPMLSRAGIGEDLLEGERARVTGRSFAVFTAMLTDALQDENCGMMREKTKLGTFAMMCRACINCSTLGLFLQRCTEFSALVNDSIELKLEREDEFACYTLKASDGAVDEEQFIVQILLAITHRLASWAIGQTIAIDAVRIARSRPGYASDYNHLFMAPVSFGQAQNSIRFSARYLDMPVVQGEQELEKFLEIPSIQLMSNPSSDNSLVARIRSKIRGDVSGNFPEFEIVADSLHMTTATLRRRLRTEGSSYQQIKDDVRRDTAIYHLGKATMSMEEVAASVGFSEPTSFFRAFKRWTGVTPRSYLQAEPA